MIKLLRLCFAWYLTRGFWKYAHDLFLDRKASERTIVANCDFIVKPKFYCDFIVKDKILLWQGQSFIVISSLSHNIIANYFFSKYLYWNFQVAWCRQWRKEWKIISLPGLRVSRHGSQEIRRLSSMVALSHQKLFRYIFHWPKIIQVNLCAFILNISLQWHFSKDRSLISAYGFWGTDFYVSTVQRSSSFSLPWCDAQVTIDELCIL